ncbi:nucleotide exchange factor Sil1p [Diutina catenulata]
MRPALLLYLASALASATICAADNDCYPQIFVPTEEWQEIRPGQDIPPGLHVRLNVDTLKKEAKLLDEDEDEGHANVYNNAKKHQMSAAMAMYTPKTHAAIDSWDAAVDEILADGDRVAPALELLAELAHDIEYGDKLTRNPQAFLKLSQLAKRDLEHQDSVYRLMASSLRNNPDAIDNAASSPHTPEMVAQMLADLKTSDDTTQKRILGVVAPLTKNKRELVEYYPWLGDGARQRLFNALEDDKRSDDTPQEEVSSYLQKRVPEEVENPEFKRYFESLVDLHERDESLRANPEFLEWLASQVQKRQGDGSEFSHEMLRARHEVFGNPMGMRKAMADEL